MARLRPFRHRLRSGHAIVGAPPFARWNFDPALRRFSLGGPRSSAQYAKLKTAFENRRIRMAYDAGDEFRRPVPLALAVLAVIGWLLAAYLWSKASETEAQMTDSLSAAERARESLAADLQNLQKSAGTAAELKAQASEAEKALSEAAAARASAQNELADLTKQIGDAKLAISGAQEEASAKSRDLQGVDARLKEETDRLAGLQTQDQSMAAEQVRLQQEVDRARAAFAEAQEQTSAAQKQFETIQSQINAGTAELNALQQQIRDAKAAPGATP
jgi:predicted  nucleic acid-binding Zn-ribbon protein